MTVFGYLITHIISIDFSVFSFGLVSIKMICQTLKTHIQTRRSSSKMLLRASSFQLLAVFRNVVTKRSFVFDKLHNAFPVWLKDPSFLREGSEALSFGNLLLKKEHKTLRESLDLQDKLFMFRKSEETPRTEIQSAQNLCPHTFFLNLFNYAYQFTSGQGSTG